MKKRTLRGALLALALSLAVPATAAESEKPAWDVDAPPGPAVEAEIDVREGTWINLDVSPDGRQIVFDLLGDIFVIPSSGGEARQLTSGMAWDMQPRYAPDGSRISFTSDRGGGDNIWIMDRDGGNPRQVTKEDFRLLNNTDWTPDGQYLAARKHYTSTRSAGAGEIWLYHVSGGDGLQMVARANDQKDINDPAFSPDGRYLYYAQDTTPGDTFEYNKDSNGQIYVIKRLDRVSGETRDYVTGAGGAARPTPSPDGKWLAFVRRVRFQSTLFLKSIESGELIPVYDTLERDMQEIWAMHGVYTGMAWTPDSKSIVFWAGGKLHRLDIGSRKVSEIPFRVRKTEQMREALRFPVNVAPADFHTKMLRWVSVSPDGDQVVYAALGHLYVRDLPNGKPRRLTRQNDHFELFPSYSRDGKRIVYVTWDDRKLGAVRIVSTGGGTGETITREPGHYVEPVFSPDGKTVVYRRIAGGYLRSPLWSEETGIFAIPARGGESRLVTRAGIQPQFGKDSDRVFLLRMLGPDKREFFSIELDGSDERTHLTSEYATAFKLSPDERWVAFTERFNAYIAPFVRTGQTVQIGPATSAIPVARVSRDAGEYLHWAGDGGTLYWSLGSELFQRDLRHAFAFIAGAPEELPEPPATGLDIGFAATTDVPSGTVAFTNARLITMNGGEIIENGTLVVENNRIKAVGPAQGTAVPRNAHVVDAAGLTIMPGIIDVHWHGAQGNDEFIPEQNWINFASLAFGVTTIHDPSNDTSEIFAASELAKAGLITAPRIFSTGTILYGATTAFTAVVNDYDDALSHLRRMKAVGAFSVKSYNQPRRNQRQQVVAAARELEMMVVPEGGALFNHNMNMIVDGHTGIEHSLPVANVYDDVLQLWSSSEVGYTPTLVVAYGGIWGERYWYQHTDVWENERLMSFVPRFVMDPVARRRWKAPEQEYNHFLTARHVNNLHEAGVNVQVGAHGQREGLGAHWEIWMLVQGGMDELTALRTATIDGARYLGLDTDLGSLQTGKLADLVVLEKNPLDNIRDSEAIRYVMVNGRLYDARTLHQIGNHAKKRDAFFWE